MGLLHYGRSLPVDIAAATRRCRKRLVNGYIDIAAAAGRDHTYIGFELIALEIGSPAGLHMQPVDMTGEVKV